PRQIPMEQTAYGVPGRHGASNFGPRSARAPSETMAGAAEARRELMSTAALVEATADGSTVELTAPSGTRTSTSPTPSGEWCPRSVGGGGT
ncbi:hypothetical protein THAOC_28669, partial [Thalassiosira oceanica]